MSRNTKSKGKRLSLPLVVGIILILIAACAIAVGIGWYTRRAAGPRPSAVPAVTVHHKIPSAPAAPTESVALKNESAALDQPAVGAADMQPLPEAVAGAEDAPLPVAETTKTTKATETTETVVADAADDEDTDAQGAPVPEGQSALTETPSRPKPLAALQEPVSSPANTDGSRTGSTGSTGSSSPVTEKPDDMVLAGPPAAEDSPQPPSEPEAAMPAPSPDTSATGPDAAGIPDPDTPSAIPQGQDFIYALQVGAYQSKANAEKKSGQMRKGGYEAFISETRSSSAVVLYAVRFGRFADKAQAREALARFKQQEDMPAIIVRMDRF